MKLSHGKGIRALQTSEDSGEIMLSVSVFCVVS